MHRLVVMALVPLLAAGCADPDAEPGAASAGDAVDMDTLTWYREGRAVEALDARWLAVGPPVYEPLALTRIGDFEGTPLYAERGAASPQRRLYIPVGGGYWQMLEQSATEPSLGETTSAPLTEDGNDTLSVPDP